MLRGTFRQRARARPFVVHATRASPRALSHRRCLFPIVDIGLVGGPRLIAEVDPPLCRCTGFAGGLRNAFRTMAEELLKEYRVARVGAEGGERHVADDRDEPDRARDGEVDDHTLR